MNNLLIWTSNVLAQLFKYVAITCILLIVLSIGWASMSCLPLTSTFMFLAPSNIIWFICTAIASLLIILICSALSQLFEFFNELEITCNNIITNKSKNKDDNSEDNSSN